jgi:2Fe-2S ferredoxin
MAGIVHVEPSGVDIPVEDGETILHAAERAGYRWPTVCHGQAICTTCLFEVVDGSENLSSPGAVETSALAEFTDNPFYEGREVRLACQSLVDGEVSAFKRGVRPGGGDR